ncbi:MAG: MATE family efflux transporter [Chitinophagaceae bacterium]
MPAFRNMAATIPDTRLQVGLSNRQILRIALPISLAILVPQLNFVINNIFLGHYNRQALATASLTGVYYLIFSMIGVGLNNGLQTLIARRAGENRPGEIGRLFGQGIFISFVIAAAGIVLTWTVAPLVLKAVIHAPETSAQAISFLKIRIWGLPFLYIYQMRNALLVGTNQSRYLVAGTLAEALANVLFDYLFIFGHWGFPAWGFNGAAVASIIAEFTGMIVIFLVIHRKGISRQFSLFSHFSWDAALARRILSLSLPLILQLAISIISWEFFFILVEHHGATALAVSSVMRNVFGLMGCVTWAFAAASSAMVSNIIGQGKKESVVGLLHRITRMSVLVSLFICGLVNLFPQTFLSIYGQDAAFVAAAIPVVRVVTVAMLVMCFGTVWLNAITGTGNSRITLLIELCAIILYCVYVYLVLERYRLPITWGWMSEWLYWSSIFVLAWLYIRSGRWKKKVI